MKRAFSLLRPGPDYLIEELIAVLSDGAWVEFKPLFLVVYANLRQRKAASGGEEMLRLRAYDKLQNMVRHGCVAKEAKRYRGKNPELANFAEHLAAQHCRTLINTVKAAAQPVEAAL